MNTGPSTAQWVGTGLFAIAVVHTFATRYFERMAHRRPAHAGLFHLLAEVETVFGVWALVFVLFLLATQGNAAATGYLEGLDYTEPMFVFVVMVIAASRPILQLAQQSVLVVARLLPLHRPVAFFAVTLSLTPLLGSFITEPAAMTLAALLLRDHVFAKGISTRLKYATLGALFVNVSIGGTLTPYAAPPVLMVAGKWDWGLGHMLGSFGWKAALAVVFNAAVVTLRYRSELRTIAVEAAAPRLAVPPAIVFAHLAFLAAVVVYAHHPVAFMGLFLFFLGVSSAYQRHQDPLMLRQGLLVAFFLAGLVTLGSQQHWWLQELLAGLHPTVLYFGATALTAITDNAALTYLGSLVQGSDDAFKYALVAGSVTGGGLTVIANAPNPAGWAILRGQFRQGAISPIGLLKAALLPTGVAIVAFQLL